jgi:hypothetical protein
LLYEPARIIRPIYTAQRCAAQSVTRFLGTFEVVSGSGEKHSKKHTHAKHGEAGHSTPNL